MQLSIIVPVLNEKENIEHLLTTLLNADKLSKEILVADGGSEDGTVEIIKRISMRIPEIRLVHNPDRYVSQAFNRCFPLAQGKYLALVGAHALYPEGYFSKCIEAIESGECDVAGGILRQQGTTTTGKAIAIAMSSKFGVGNTPFRTMRERMLVDSVAFAVYPRMIFDKAGLFDESLIRNQDDEFHYRLNSLGLRILMLPELEVVYFVRDSLKGLFSQYFQYGLYKPLVIRKVRTGLKLRHLVPALFVTYLSSIPLSLQFPFWGFPLIGYIFFCIGAGVMAKASILSKSIVPFVFPTLHISYGMGFIYGLYKFKNN